ncbi:MAG: hypothetical protein ACERLM_15525, partial [Acidimicrobiales bacterium]
MVAGTVLLAACGDGSDRAAPVPGTARESTSTSSTTSTSTSTTTSTSTSTSTSTTTTTSTTVPPTWSEAAGCATPPPAAVPDPNRPRYRAAIALDPAVADVSITERVEFTPEVAVDHLIFRLWANAPRLREAGTGISVTSVTGPAVRDWSQPDPTTLRVDLNGPAPAGSTVVVELGATLTVAGPVRDRVSRSAGSLRLGTVLPVLAWEPGRGWAEEPATSAFAESVVTPTADFVVEVVAPEGVEILATGVEVAPGRWEAIAVRDFALSAGRFDRAAVTVDLPDPVVVTVAVHDSVGESAEGYLSRITEDLQLAALAYGPYPWPSFSMVVTPDLRGGIEFPSHVMQGPGSSGRTTPHEVAHQWFYGLVGNHQGRDPWLDEGIATYAEGRLEGTRNSMATKAIPAAGQGRAGEPMTFWEGRQDAYYRSVYVQTAL